MDLHHVLLSFARIAGVALCVLAAAVPGSLWAEEPAEPAPPAEPQEEAVAPELLARIQGLLAALGDEEQAKREEAEQALQAIGKPAIPLLKETMAATEDAEVRLRCRRLVEDWEVGRFDRLLAAGFREDRAFLDGLKDLWDRASPKLDETAWEKTLAEGKGRIVVPELDEILAEPCRFYLVPGSACGFLSRPPVNLTVGVTEKGVLFLLGFSLRRHEGLPALAKRLKPVKDEAGARRAGVLAARLLAMCQNCLTWPGYPAPAEKAASVAALEGGGFEVTVPDTGGGGAKVVFAADGTLASALRVGHPCRRR